MSDRFPSRPLMCPWRKLAALPRLTHPWRKRPQRCPTSAERDPRPRRTGLSIYGRAAQARRRRPRPLWHLHDNAGRRAASPAYAAPLPVRVFSSAHTSRCTPAWQRSRSRILFLPSTRSRPSPPPARSLPASPICPIRTISPRPCARGPARLHRHLADLHSARLFLQTGLVSSLQAMLSRACLIEAPAERWQSG